VWIKEGFKCWLKKHYDPSRNTIPCKSCIAYSADGQLYLYSLTTGSSSTSYESKMESTHTTMTSVEGGSFVYRFGGLWAKATEGTLCSAKEGFDQSHEFDLWVWHSNSNECYLKNDYDYRSETECDDCVAYNPSAEYKVYGEAETTGSESSTWTQRLFGVGTSWKASSGTENCLFTQGLDQPEEFNLEGGTSQVENAYLCCNACDQNDQCKSWVWKANSNECILKKEYDESRNTIPCADCVAYSAKGAFYLFESSSRKTDASEVDIHDYTTWAQEGGIWMPVDIAKKPKASISRRNTTWMTLP